MRKANLARLLARRIDGIHLADFEQGEIGPDLFRHACLMGLEGMVSEHRESSYRGGRSLDQGQEPAASRVQPSTGTVLAGTIAPVQRRFSGGAFFHPRSQRHRQRGPGFLLVAPISNRRASPFDGCTKWVYSMTKNHSTKGKSTKEHSRRHGGTPLVVACAVAAFGLLALLIIDLGPWNKPKMQ
jgi:hypothetical protein